MLRIESLLETETRRYEKHIHAGSCRAGLPRSGVPIERSDANTC